MRFQLRLKCGGVVIWTRDTAVVQLWINIGHLENLSHRLFLPERPEAGHRGDGPAKRGTWLGVWGQQKSLQGPFRSYKPVLPHTHRFPHRSTHTSGRWGKHTVLPVGEEKRQRLWFLKATLPFFSTSSPSLFPCRLRPAHVIRHSLMLHYPYTSLSMSVLLKAMFTDAASKLGHVHDTHRHKEGQRW